MTFSHHFGNPLANHYHNRSVRQSLRQKVSGNQLEREVRLLENKIERLRLVTRGLWEIVRDHTPITEDMLEAKVKEIDLRDGKADGRETKSVEACQSCGRNMQKGQDTCQYCGAVQGFDSIFDWVR